MLFNILRNKYKVFSWFLMAFSMLLLASCGSKQLRPAPVEDRNAPVVQKNSSGEGEVAPVAKEAASAANSASAPAAPAPAVLSSPTGAENAGKPGYYTVKQGDTLARIGLEAGQPYRDIARWNGLADPNRIETGQVLRIIPPGAPEEGVVTRPIAASKPSATPLPPAGKAVQPASTPATAASAPAPVSAPAVGAAPASMVEDDVSFIWPARGDIVATFDETKNRKGLDIGGVAGTPILAAADGKVVYAGSGLRGYGNLIIMKHSATYLTAYAHNQALLVKEEQVVKQGQKIAEMGNSDADQVKLHFEVRKMGKPVDPAKYLPIR
jgi:lipoprotein NlpD